MRCPAIPDDEQARLRALAEYGLSGAEPLPSLQPIVQIAARMFGVPASAVNMVGRDEAFFAASAGIGECDLRRDVSFCAHVINEDDVLVIPDALLDERFHDNPLVTGPERIRFYAGVALRSPGGQPVGALCIVDSKPHDGFSQTDRDQLKDLARIACDKLELRRLDWAMQGSRSRFESSARSSPVPILCFDASGTITAANGAAECLFGDGCADLVGRPLAMILPEWRPELAPPSAPDGTGIGKWPRQLPGRRFDGSDVPLEAAWSQWSEDGEVHFGATLRDLTEVSRQQAQLVHLAHHDPVTALPNRLLLQRRLAAAIEGGAGASVILVGLGGLAETGDTLGRRARDQALREVAARLVQCAGPDRLVARVSSNEFTVIAENGPIEIAALSAEIIDAVRAPIHIADQPVRLAASCGIALSSLHGSDPEELIGNAGLALVQARREGAERAVFYVPALRMQAIARRMFDSELHRAVESGELTLHYQPQVRVADGQTIGAEALIRWNHPERGLLSPAAFLPALEDSALAARVGEWVVDSACAQAAIWRTSLDPDFRMGINLFAAQLRRRDLRRSVGQSLTRYNLPPSAIKLEITENIILDGDTSFLASLQDLRADGINLAFDDFGTGYASLSLLKRYPLTHLKIDKGFVQAACVSKGDRAIVEAIVDLARRFELQVIAEGVETWEQFELCEALGCDEIQGYLLGRPLPAEDFAQNFLSGPPGKDRATRLSSDPAGSILLQA